MSRFRKNNIISDDESDDEISDIDSDINNSDSNSSVEEVSDHTATSSKNNSFEEEARYVPSSDAENSPIKASDSDCSAPELPNSKIKNTSRGEDVNKNNSKTKNRHTQGSRQSIVENSISCDVGDVLVLESSTSVVNESVIESSFHGIINGSSKGIDPYKSRIIEESTDSEISIEYDSLKSTPLVSNSQKVYTPPQERYVIDSSQEIEVIESPSINNSIKSISRSTIQSTNSSRISQSEISDVSHSSISSTSSINEKRAVERQLADKRTAYQNILRAVKSCDPKKLKDGGKLLQEKLAKCKEEVDELKERLKGMGDVSDTSLEKYSTKSNLLLSTNDQVTANLGKKALETHRVEAALTVDALVTIHSSLETCPAEDVHEKDPKGLRVELMPHQKYALAWLLWREQQLPPGGILADDMGLGKTLTMIALVLRSEEYKKLKNIEEENTPFVVDNVKIYPGKTLVVCPSSLMGQWQGQIKQHCKSNLLSTLVHHGKPRELQAKKLAAFDIVITSYGIVVEENKIIKSDKKGPLFRVKWERVIIDEGHTIRNHKTKSAQALCELEAKYRWCLTGTPVQNKELDMYSLLKFLRCSPFDNLTVWKRWVDNKSANGVRRLNTVVKSILLRRTKEELKTLGELEELPAKTYITVPIKLDEEEQKVYHTVLQFSKTLLAEFILQEEKKLGNVSDELRNEHRKLLGSVGQIKTTEIFVLLLRLRQICCLPELIHSMLEKESCEEDGIDPEDDPILQDLTSQMKRVSIAGSSHITNEYENKNKILVQSNPVFQVNRPSVKIRKVLEIVKEALEADDKIIIVSQWATLLQKLKTHIVQLKTGVALLDGSVPVKLRPSIIESFNSKKSDTKVLLLSLTAGGVGLNLVGGNRLVIFEPHWNPQLESQACDRIYRVGQKKEVYIYKLICHDTIEERIQLLQKKKLEIANSVLKGELKMKNSKLTLADLKILFDIHS